MCAVFILISPFRCHSIFCFSLVSPDGSIYKLVLVALKMGDMSKPEPVYSLLIGQAFKLSLDDLNTFLEWH